MISAVPRRFRFLSPRGVIFLHFVRRRGSSRSRARHFPPPPEGDGFRCRRRGLPSFLSEDAWAFLRRLRSSLPLSEDAGKFGRRRGLAGPCPKTRAFLAAGTRRLAPDRSRDRRTSHTTTGRGLSRFLVLRHGRGPGSAVLVPNAGLRPSVVSVRGRMTPSMRAPKRFRRGPCPKARSDTTCCRRRFVRGRHGSGLTAARRPQSPLAAPRSSLGAKRDRPDARPGTHAWLGRPKTSRSVPVRPGPIRSRSFCPKAQGCLAGGPPHKNAPVPPPGGDGLDRKGPKVPPHPRGLPKRAVRPPPPKGRRAFCPVGSGRSSLASSRGSSFGWRSEDRRPHGLPKPTVRPRSPKGLGGPVGSRRMARVERRPRMGPISRWVQPSSPEGVPGSRRSRRAAGQVRPYVVYGRYQRNWLRRVLCV